MATATDIANEALHLATAGSIGNINDSTRNAGACKTALPLAKLELFRQYDWNCLLKRAKLAQLSEAPVFGYKYAYQLPSDFIKLSKTSLGRAYTWKVEGKKILTNSPTLYIVYVADTEDYTILSGDLRAALSAKLAVLIAPIVTTKPGVMELCSKAYNAALGNAIASDSSENSPEDAIDADDWVNARHGLEPDTGEA